MKKNHIISYLKIAGILLLLFPLIHCFWLLELGNNTKAYMVSISMYLGEVILGIILYNYLENVKYTKNE